MKRFFTMGVACLLSAGLFLACSDMRYDISEGFDKDITLFAEEISVPIGSIGPITVESLLLKSEIGQSLAEFLSVQEDGSFQLESKTQIFAINVHRLEKEAGDVSEAFTYKGGDQRASISGIVSMLGLLDLQPLEQAVELTATNPLTLSVPFRTTFGVSSKNAGYSTSTPLDIKLSSYRYEPYSIYKFALPASVHDMAGDISLKSLELDLPAHPVNRIANDTRGDVFSFVCKHTCKIGTSEKFNFSQEVFIEDAKLEIGKYQLSECDVNIVLENTLPLSATINGVEVLKSVEPEVVDENITVTPGITIAGGSPEAPGVTNLKLHIAAKTGTIPDLHAIQIDLLIKTQPGCEDVPLSGKQGLYVKSSSAKLSGGITIPLNKTE